MASKISIKQENKTVQVKKQKNQVFLNGRVYAGILASGGNDKNYTISFPISNGGIVVNHNLNKIPTPIVFDSTNRKVGSINMEVINNNTFELSWVGAFSGTVSFN